MIAAKASAPASVGGRNFFCPPSNRARPIALRSRKHSHCDWSSRASRSSHLSSASCELLCAFCSDHPLFSISFGLFCQKQGVGGMLVKKSPRPIASRASVRSAQPSLSGPYFCPDADGNTVCCDGGIGTSPLRSRQRMEFNTWLLASSAWRQFIVADAFAPAAVGALAL